MQTVTNIVDGKLDGTYYLYGIGYGRAPMDQSDIKSYSSKDLIHW